MKPIIVKDDMHKLGKVAYEAYCSVSDGKSLVSGDPLPQWEDLPPKIKGGWIEAAIAVYSKTEEIQVEIATIARMATEMYTFAAPSSYYGEQDNEHNAQYVLRCVSQARQIYNTASGTVICEGIDI